MGILRVTNEKTGAVSYQLDSQPLHAHGGTTIHWGQIGVPATVSFMSEGGDPMHARALTPNEERAFDARRGRR